MTRTEPQLVCAQERKALTVHNLFLYLRQFKDDNKNDYMAENRWLAEYLTPLIEITQQIYTGGKCDEVMEQVREFRRQELKTEILLKQTEAADLERELEMLK